ncbi:MAG: hypothetical protein ACWA5L_10675 [bacterium]
MISIGYYPIFWNAMIMGFLFGYTLLWGEKTARGLARTVFRLTLTGGGEH